MSEEALVRVRLFGEYRNWVPEGVLRVDLAGRETVAQAKTAIAEALAKIGPAESISALIKVSALAEDARILQDSEKIRNLRASAFALLPPVCGG